MKWHRAPERIIVTNGTVQPTFHRGPTMKNHYDPWYVRLPDGRTIKAKSTASVRHHVEAGHIPLNSLVRRDSNEEWVALVWVAEFADLGKVAGSPMPTLAAGGGIAAPRSGVAARLDPLRLQTVGVRGLIDELIAALDSTLTRSKMVPAFFAALLLFLGMYAIRAVVSSIFSSPTWPLVAEAGFAIVVVSILNAILAKVTHLELSTMRPARLREAMRTLGGYIAPVLVANVLVAGAGLAVILLIQGLPEWGVRELGENHSAETASVVLFTALLVLVYLLSAIIWIVIGMCWLLTAAIVVEESSWLAGVREWRQLLRENFGRIVVYEGLTLMLGVAISLPLILAVGLALYTGPTATPQEPLALNRVIHPIHSVLYGLSVSPLLALVPVANVFIYLNLRYEQAPGR
jgi:hypothetical protein